MDGPPFRSAGSILVFTFWYTWCANAKLIWMTSLVELVSKVASKDGSSWLSLWKMTYCQYYTNSYTNFLQMIIRLLIHIRSVASFLMDYHQILKLIPLVCLSMDSCDQPLSLLLRGIVADDAMLLLVILDPVTLKKTQRLICGCH